MADAANYLVTLIEESPPKKNKDSNSHTKAQREPSKPLVSTSNQLSSASSSSQNVASLPNTESKAAPSASKKASILPAGLAKPSTNAQTPISSATSKIGAQKPFGSQVNINAKPESNSNSNSSVVANQVPVPAIKKQASFQTRPTRAQASFAPPAFERPVSRSDLPKLPSPSSSSNTDSSPNSPERIHKDDQSSNQPKSSNQIKASNDAMKQTDTKPSEGDQVTSYAMTNLDIYEGGSSSDSESSDSEPLSPSNQNNFDNFSSSSSSDSDESKPSSIQPSLHMFKATSFSPRKQSKSFGKDIDNLPIGSSNVGSVSSNTGSISSNSSNSSNPGWTEARRPVGGIFPAFDATTNSFDTSVGAFRTPSGDFTTNNSNNSSGYPGFSSAFATPALSMISPRLNRSSQDESMVPPSSSFLSKRLPITVSIHHHRNTNDSDSDDEPNVPKKMTWNEAFQQAIELPDHNDFLKQERAETIAQIAQDFVTTAIMFGKIIISEVFLPNESKTIKATTGFGGNAGGEKYVFNGILFKFAVDWKEIYSSDEYAMKAAALELKGLEQFLDFSPGIRVPLMCLIDYLGFRLIALSLLPINNTTLIYGSDDAGFTVKSQDPQSHMKKAGIALNLKEHVAGQKPESTSLVCFPADIEGHIGTDKRFYVLDLARLMPPTAPDKSKVASQYLFRLFRPEFVRGYKVPLSPDSFSNFDKCDPNKDLNRREIVDATNALFEHILAKVGAIEATCTFNDRTRPSQFIDLIHKAGINLRYLPMVRNRVGPYLRTFVMLEMIARGIKNHLRSVLRTAVREQMTMALQPYRAAIVDQFNIMLGNVPERKRESTTFWSLLHTKLQTQFDGFPSTEALRRELQRDLPGIFMINKVCTSSPHLAEDMPPMISYECYTCDLLYPQGLCQVCAQTCHATHSLSKPKWRSSTYCSCAIPSCCRSFELKLAGGDHPLKTFAEVIGIGRVFERAADLAGIALSKDARNELETSPHQFIFVLPDIKDLLLKSKQLTITTLAEAQSLHLAARNRNAYERTRMFHQSNNLFEKTLKMSPGARSLRVLFLSTLYEQITLCGSNLDDRILAKCVHYCQELRDAKVARALITSLYNQPQEVVTRISDHLQICFSIVLETGQTLKSNERTEVLEFIAHFGGSLISLDLGSNPYSMILDDDILTKLAEGCQKLQQLRLNYNGRRVSDACLNKVAASWKGLRHIDLSSSPVNDNVLCAFAQNCPFMRTLDISSCPHLTSAAFKYISKLNDLTVLNISYNEISEVSNLAHCERLALLTMRDCPISKSQFSRMLAPMGKSSTSLKVLELSLCRPDHPSVITEIYTNCTELQHLYLDGWHGVSEDILIEKAPKSRLHLSLKGWKIHQGTYDALKALKLKVDLDTDSIIPGDVISVTQQKEKDSLGRSVRQTLSDFAHRAKPGKS